MGKIDNTCKMVKDFTSIEFEIKRGLLRTIKFCFKERVEVQKRMALDKCLKINKMRSAWAGKCLIVK